MAKHRVDIEITDEDEKYLKAMSKAEGVTITEALRYALKMGLSECIQEYLEEVEDEA